MGMNSRSFLCGNGGWQLICNAEAVPYTVMMTFTARPAAFNRQQGSLLAVVDGQLRRLQGCV